jgi:hypothetical protein
LFGLDRRLSLTHGLCDPLVFECDSKESIPGHFECFVSDRLFSKQTKVERSDQIFVIEVIRANRTFLCMFELRQAVIFLFLYLVGHTLCRDQR